MNAVVANHFGLLGGGYYGPPPGVPSAPTSVQVISACESAQVVWSPPTTDGGSPITSYTVRVRAGSDVVATDTVDGGTFTDTVTGLTDGTAYTVTVSASNVAGEGAESAPIDVTPLCVPTQPLNVVALSLCGSTKVSWDTPLHDGGRAITGYIVWVRNAGQLVSTDRVDASQLHDTLMNLANGTTYTVTVSALNALGNGPPSDPTTVVPNCGPSVPSVPTEIFASPLCGGAELDWSPPTSDGGNPITGYVVFVRSNGSIVATDVVDGGTFGDAISGLTNGTTYDMTVAAVNALGVGVESSPVEIAPECAQSAPDAPYQVSASPLCGGIEVDWNPPLNDGGSPVTGYTVFVRLNGSIVATDNISDGSTFIDDISGLTNGTTYDVTVAAVNAIGVGAESDPPVEIAPECPATPPTAPLSVTAAPQCESVNVGWNTPADDGGVPIESYTVYVRSGALLVATDTVDASQLSDVLSGLTDGTTYDVTVAATNEVGLGPESSPPVSVTPVCAPGAPVSVTAAAQCEATTVGWDAPSSDGGSPITNYTVFVRSGATLVATDTVGGATFSDIITGLIDGTSYSVTVAAQNALGAGDESSPPVSVTPVCAPDPPVSVTAAAECEATNVGWNAPTSDGGSPITGYTVFVRSGATLVATDTVGGSTFGDTISGLTDGTTYTVTVGATNAVGNSDPSSPPVSVTPVCAPTAPLSVTAAPHCESTSVGWSSPASDGGSAITGYTVFVRSGASLVATDSVGGSASSDTISGLVDGTTYSVTVAATNAIGTSAESSVATVTPVCAPSAPQTVAAVAQCAGAFVTWNAPSFLGGTPITGYKLNVRNGSNLVSFLTGGSASSDTISGLNGGTTYTVTVQATNAARTSVESSPPVSFTTTCVPVTLRYIGPTVRGAGGNPLNLVAQLSSPVSACVNNETIVFSLDRNPVTQSAGSFTIASFKTNPGGVANGHVNTSSWQAGSYTLTAAFAGGTASHFNCAPATTTATLTVFSRPAGGGPPPPLVTQLADGVGAIAASGGTAFNFTIQLSRFSANPTGQFTLLNGNGWRMTGALTSYTSSLGVSTVSGVGNLYFLNHIGLRFLIWQLAAHNVPITLTFTPGAAGVATLGIQIIYAPVAPQPSQLPNTTPVPLSAGFIEATH